MATQSLPTMATQAPPSVHVIRRVCGVVSVEAYLLRMVTTVAISYGLQADCGRLTMTVDVM
jgi:hypothetical protein